MSCIISSGLASLSQRSSSASETASSARRSGFTVSLRLLDELTELIELVLGQPRQVDVPVRLPRARQLDAHLGGGLDCKRERGQIAPDRVLERIQIDEDRRRHAIRPTHDAVLDQISVRLLAPP